MWDLEKIQDLIGKKLKKIKALDRNHPFDHSGGTIPISLAILGILELIDAGDFHGGIELQLKGHEALNPKRIRQTHRMMDSHNHLLAGGSH
jgi:hypothetical protein